MSRYCCVVLQATPLLLLYCDLYFNWISKCCVGTFTSVKRVFEILHQKSTSLIISWAADQRSDILTWWNKMIQTFFWSQVEYKHQFYLHISRSYGVADELLTGSWWNRKFRGSCRSKVWLHPACCSVHSDIKRSTGSAGHGGCGGVWLGQLHQSSVGDEDPEDQGGSGGGAEEDAVRQVRPRLLWR